MSKRVSEETKAPQEVKHEEHLHTKYRPRKLKDVIGHKAVVSSLEAALKAKSRPHCFLFTGPAGTGKTTLARIVAERLDVETTNVVEIDAASNTGIDDMRKVLEALRYNGFGDSPNRAIIVNECHRLSAQAWDSMLMTTEEPPPHAFFFFTSTHPDKIPKAMLTRCLGYDLNPLRFDDIMDELEAINEAEQFGTSNKILQQVARAAEGSMRAALVGLAKVHACEDVEEAAALLAQPLENAEIIDLARALVRDELKWTELCETLKKLEAQGTQPESIRLVIVNYLNACAMGARKPDDIERYLDMLSAFMKPCTGSEKFAPLLLAFGRFLFP
jgi:DNA polymerase-3 subunit gamma/tau